MKNYLFKKYAVLLTALLSGILYFTGCANLFQEKVPKNIFTTGSLSDMFAPVEEISSLSKPDQIFVSNGSYPDKMLISWSSVPNAASYRLEWARIPLDTLDINPLPDESDFVFLRNVYATNYTHKILDNPTYLSAEYSYAYFYRVSAENKNMKYDASPFIVSGKAELLAPPQDVQADLGASTNAIRISWKKNPHAVSYEILRTENPNGMLAESIKTVPGNQNRYTNTISKNEQGKNFYYIIRAVSRNEKSVKSAIAYGYTLTEGAPPKVSVKVTEGRGHSIDSIKIEWTVSVAETDVSYAVYRSDSTDPALTLLKKDCKVISYEDKSRLTPGVYYYYYVQAWTKDPITDTELKSAMSDSGSNSKSPAEGYIASPPSYAAVDRTNDGITLAFTPAIGNNEEQKGYTYCIYASAAADTGFTLLTEKSPPHAIGEDGYIYCTLTQDSPYYRISTKNALGIESAQSRAFAPVPFAAENIAASRYQNTGGTANSLGVYPVKITWQAPQNDNPAFYDVYRSQKPDSGFIKITQEPLTALSYIDENESAKAGRRYYYKVLTLNSLKQGKNFSDVKQGWGALTPEQYFKEYNKTVMSGQKKMTLMHKGGTSALGSEQKNGDISGIYTYNAKMAGIGARIIMRLTDYADFYIDNKAENGRYFILNGEMNTSANMSSNGTMDGTVNCTGMYPGRVSYDKIEIKSGAAGGGYYVVTPDGFPPANVSYTAGM